MVAGNTFTERERRLWGADLVLSYKPLRNNQFQSITWGTEVLYSDNRYDVTDSLGHALPGQSVGSLGLYSYLTYKFHREWSAGFLFEYVENEVNNQDKTFAYSPYITWAFSHWSQLRLQYTYTDPNAASGRPPDSAVYLQWAWIIGSHSHGWQQR
jgi:outer membrane protein assembly factor BamA